ncbi:hypothetical protein M413DRAFT_444350 [Hebeloma cylindrosporum]|uniref:Uncharacterized protein n=1 Tax=Hebeloma cylindrosporum TaxID=76867 RepID=A0A0C3CGG2_HEBCY|nr:hypothetical protein M413DRAFT_444350 [Hebeloma cylindrosporum h7]
MKFVASSLIVLATSLSATYAWDCTNGREYCGKVLLDTSNMKYNVWQNLWDRGITVEKDRGNMLFRCLGGNNIVEYQEYCKYGCQENTSGSDDACNPEPASD